MHVCVIGAGVIGVTSAWLLANNGYQVTLIDSQAEPASGTSFANGGQLSYNYVAPLAAPGVFKDLPKWLWDRQSPLRFRPRMDVHQWWWLWQFLRVANSKKAAQTTRELLDLAQLSRDTLDALVAASPMDFAHQRDGKLIVYRSRDAFAKAQKQVAYQAQLGSRQELPDRAACVKLEPALEDIKNTIVGAIYTPSEESGDCALFTRQLYQKLVALPQVNVRMQTRVCKFTCQHQRICTLYFQDGEHLEVDQLLLAAGMGNNALLALLGLPKPLYALKGYSLSMPLQGHEKVPHISVTDYERRTVYAHLGTQLRIAAMLGIGLDETSIEADRIATLKRQVGELLPSVSLDDAQTWAGSRPATATGKPIVGKSSRYSNLWLNMGQGALGFTLACGSAQWLLDRLLEKPLDRDINAFSPAAYRI